MNGFIVIDKPAGMTSHDVVNTLRRLTKQKKAGHTGTLDPFATGVLPIALGEATKIIPYLDEAIKEYRAIMRLGIASDTQDCTGQTLTERSWQHISCPDVMQVATRFTGQLSQVPPMFSAIKRNGVPLYRLARRGEEVVRESRTINVYELLIESCELPDITFVTRCSRGTYVRTLAADMGESLGCGAHLTSLRRIASGPFTITKAITLEEIVSRAAGNTLEEIIISPQAAISHLPAIQVNGRGAVKISHGAIPEPDDMSLDEVLQKGLVRFLMDDKLLAVAENYGEMTSNGGKNLRLLRVLN